MILSINELFYRLRHALHLGPNDAVGFRVDSMLVPIVEWTERASRLILDRYTNWRLCICIICDGPGDASRNSASNTIPRIQSRRRWVCTCSHRRFPGLMHSVSNSWPAFRACYLVELGVPEHVSPARCVAHFRIYGSKSCWLLATTFPASSRFMGMMFAL